MKFAFPKSQFLTKINFPVNLTIKHKYFIHLIVLLNLAITIPLGAILNIWTDEAYSLNTAGKSLQYAVNQGINFELQPPLYFILLNIWHSINDSIFWARFLSIICITLTIYIVDLLVERYIETIDSVWIVTIFAFNPFTIKVALEIRVYALAMLLSALLLLFFFDGYLARKAQSKAKVIYLGLAIIALYSQYYLACLLVGNAIALFLLWRPRALKSYLWGMSLVALCFSPMLFFLANQVSTHANPSENNFWQNFIDIQRSKMAGFLENFSNLPPTILICFFLLILTLLLGLIFTTDLRLINSNHGVIWIINITSIAFFCGVLVVTNGFLLFRHTVGIFIIFLLGFFLLLSLIKYPKIRNITVIFITTIALLFYAQNLYKNYSNLAKAGDWKRVATYIMRSEQPQQEILVFTSISAEELSYYYDGINQIVPLPKADDFKKYDLQNYALNNEEEVVQALTSDRHDLWLVERVNRNCKSFDVNLNCHILENFISKYYQVENSQKFYKSRVRFLKRKPKN